MINQGICKDDWCFLLNCFELVGDILKQLIIIWNYIFEVLKVSFLWLRSRVVFTDLNSIWGLCSCFGVSAPHFSLLGYIHIILFLDHKLKDLVKSASEASIGIWVDSERKRKIISEDPTSQTFYLAPNISLRVQKMPLMEFLKHLLLLVRKQNIASECLRHE